MNSKNSSYNKAAPLVLWTIIFVCFNPNQCGGGAPRAPPSRYRSAISTRFEITSFPLVTFNFKTFPKHRRTQFLNFLAQIWETGVWRQEVSIDFEKKNEKIWFFQFFLKQIILFLFEIEFYVKNAFFRGIACWNSSKIINLESLLILKKTTNWGMDWFIIILDVCKTYFLRISLFDSGKSNCH